MKAAPAAIRASVRTPITGQGDDEPASSWRPARSGFAAASEEPGADSDDDMFAPVAAAGAGSEALGSSAVDPGVGGAEDTPEIELGVRVAETDGAVVDDDGPTPVDAGAAREVAVADRVFVVGSSGSTGVAAGVGSIVAPGSGAVVGG